MIYKATTGGVKPVSGTFDLGEKGRSRTLVPFDAARAPTLGHCVRVDTMSTYTRGAPGSIGIMGGGARVLVSGTKAWGDAGNLGSGPDAVIHFPPGSAARVVFSGGRGKGQGARYILAPHDGSEPVVVDALDQGTPPAYAAALLEIYGATLPAESITALTALAAPGAY